MNHNKIKKLMMGFSQEQLKSYLDQDILDSLIEWNSDDGLYTKSKLIELILTIKGLSILKDKDFRVELLKRFEPEMIFEFKGKLPEKYSDCRELEELIDVIASQPWKESELVELFLKDVGYTLDDLFDNNRNDEKAISNMESHGKFYELLDYQYIIRQKILTRLNSKEPLTRLLVHMPTGTGKTKTAMHTICNYYNYSLQKKGLILWVAHTKELLDQAYETFCNVWSFIGNGNINVYRDYDIYDIKSDDVEEFNGIMICSIQKLMLMGNSNPNLYDKIKRDLKLIVYDEAHKAAADQTRKVIEDLMTRKGGLEDRSLVGLTATPGRTNDQSFDNKLLSAMFDNCLISIDTQLMTLVNHAKSAALLMDTPKDIIKYFQDRKVLSKVTKEELTYTNDISESELQKIRITANSNGYEDFSADSLKIFAQSKNRNLKILSKLFELNKAGIPTIVFACSVKHAQLLSAMLSVANVNNVCVYGNMPSNERKAAIEKFKNRDNDCNIIVNYEVLTTGFDSTNIKCVFITRPTQSIVLYSQMLGRGLRGPQMGGNENCLLVDVKDNLSKYNENMAFGYFNNYWGGK